MAALDLGAELQGVAAELVRVLRERHLELIPGAVRVVQPAAAAGILTALAVEREDRRIDRVEIVVAPVAGELRFEQVVAAEDLPVLGVPHPLRRIFGHRLVVAGLGRGPVADAAGHVVDVVLRSEDQRVGRRRLERELHVEARADVGRLRHRSRRVLVLRIALDAAEEERLVALQRSANLDGVVDELGDGRGVAKRRVRGEELLTDVVARQRVVRVAQREETGKRVRAGLRHGVDDRSREPAVLRGRAESSDLDFLNQVLVEERPGRPTFRVARIDAVHEQRVAVRALGAVGRAAVDARCVVQQPRGRRRVDRHQGQEVRADGRFGGRAPHVNRRGRSPHLDVLAEARELQRKIHGDGSAHADLGL